MSGRKASLRFIAKDKENTLGDYVEDVSDATNAVKSTLSPRTPRRACKDLALARLLAPADFDYFFLEQKSSPRRARTTSGVCGTPERKPMDARFAQPTPKTPLRTPKKTPSLSINSPVRRLRSLSISSQGRPVARNQVQTVDPKRATSRTPVQLDNLRGDDDDDYEMDSDSSSVTDSSADSTSESTSDSCTESSDSDTYSPWRKKRSTRGRVRPGVRAPNLPLGTPKRGLSKPELGSSSKVVGTPKRSILPRRTMSVQPSVGRSVANSEKNIYGCLPGREHEFDNIYTFIAGKLLNNTGGCMYISGLPGTGKTASVNAVLASMSDTEHPSFRKIVINGMQVSDPQQVYVQILQQLTGQIASAKQACQLLEREFCARTVGRSARSQAPSSEVPIVLVIDELDLLCTRRQDVLYNLFDWPSRPRGRHALIVLAIANTMDLPERLLHPRVASRLGMTRLTFAPYSHEQLVRIVQARLTGTVSAVFQEKAIELAARKVAAVSGDVRRVLDICRRAAEIATVCQSPAKPSKFTASKMAPVTVDMQHINAALKEMFTTPKLTAIRACSVYEKLFLRALVAEFQARSSEEARLERCIMQMCALCRLEDFPCPTSSEVFGICSSLGAHKLLLTEASRRDTAMLIRLNCSKADVLFALKQPA